LKEIGRKKKGRIGRAKKWNGRTWEIRREGREKKERKKIARREETRHTIQSSL